MNKDIAKEYYIDDNPIMEWTEQAKYCFNHMIKEHKTCDTCPYDFKFDSVDECAMKYVVVKLYTQIGGPNAKRKNREFMLDNGMKKCKKCKEVKSKDNFFKYKQSKDGLFPMCKECYSAYRKNHR